MYAVLWYIKIIRDVWFTIDFDYIYTYFFYYWIIIDLHNATSIPIMNWIFLDFLIEWSYRDLAESSRAKQACQVHELVEFSAIIPEQTYTSVLV